MQQMPSWPVPRSGGKQRLQDVPCWHKHWAFGFRLHVGLWLQGWVHQHRRQRHLQLRSVQRRVGLSTGFKNRGSQVWTVQQLRICSLVYLVSCGTKFVVRNCATYHYVILCPYRRPGSENSTRLPFNHGGLARLIQKLRR